MAAATPAFQASRCQCPYRANVKPPLEVVVMIASHSWPSLQPIPDRHCGPFLTVIAGLPRNLFSDCGSSPQWKPRLSIESGGGVKTNSGWFDYKHQGIFLDTFPFTLF